MKFVNQIDNIKSEDDEKLNQADLGDTDIDDEDDLEEDNKEDDDEHSEDDKENMHSNDNKVILQKSPVDEGNKKQVLEKGKTKKPSTQKLVDEAIKDLNERAGSSVRAISKYIMSRNPDVVKNRLNMHIKRYVANCVADGTMLQIKRSFKFTKKHGMKKKEKLDAKKENQKEKPKINKEKKNAEKTEKTVEKKSAKKEKSTRKSEIKIKTTKQLKKTKSEGKVKPEKIENAAKSTKTTESKKIINPKSKSKQSPGISANLVVVPTAPAPKATKDKNTTVTATASKKKGILPASESVSVAVKATGRVKRTNKL